MGDSPAAGVGERREELRRDRHPDDSAGEVRCDEATVAVDPGERRGEVLVGGGDEHVTAAGGHVVAFVERVAATAGHVCPVG